MNDYDALSPLYDRLQDGLPVERLAVYADDLVATHGRIPRGRGDGGNGRRLLLDLGCGTGRFARAMAALDYDVVGIDASGGMLRQAMEAEAADPAGILYLQQDICDFELFGTVDAICCLTDTINHITARPALRRCLRLCHHYLNPGGALVFDIATRRHFARRLGQRVLYQVEDDAVMLWRNSFHPSRDLNTADIVLFTKNGDGTWNRGDETIRERAYGIRTMTTLLREAGFPEIRTFSAFRETTPGPSAERVFFVCTKAGASCPESPA
jgi:SAM-dependent methyltransferase